MIQKLSRFFRCIPAGSPAAGAGARLALGLVLIAVFSGSGIALAAETLITRPLDQSEVEVTTEEYELVVDISAFDEIRNVEINGEAQNITQGDTVRVRSVQHLATGRNTFLVTVNTESESVSKEYVITRVLEASTPDELEEREGPLGLIFMIGAQQNSNVLLDSTNEESGVKLFAIAIPTYTNILDETSKIRVRGIFSRETYSDEKFKDAEIGFNQVLALYIKGPSELDNWSVGAGFNKIYTGFGVTGDNDAEQDIFVVAALRGELASKAFYILQIDFMDRDRPDPTDTDFNEDAMVITLKADYDHSAGAARGRLKAWYTIDDTDGKFAAKTELRLSADYKFPASSLFGSGESKLVLGLGAKYRAREFDESGQKDTLTGLSVKGIHPITKDSLFIGQIASEQQSSDDPDAEYSNLVLMGAVIFIY